MAAICKTSTSENKELFTNAFKKVNILDYIKHVYIQIDNTEATANIRSAALKPTFMCHTEYDCVVIFEDSAT